MKKTASGEEASQEVQDSEETRKGRFRKWYLPGAALLVIGISLFLLDRWDNFFPATITPEEAVEHVGRTVRVKGTPSDTYRHAGTLHLRYGPRSPDHVFSVEVPPAFVQRVFGPDSVWSQRHRMREVTVIGEVQLKEGRVFIVLKDAKHLEYLELPEPEDVRGLAALFHEDDRVFERELKKRGAWSAYNSVKGSPLPGIDPDYFKNLMREDLYLEEAGFSFEMRQSGLAASRFAAVHGINPNNAKARLAAMKSHADSKLDLHQIGRKILGVEVASPSIEDQQAEGLRKIPAEPVVDSRVEGERTREWLVEGLQLWLIDKHVERYQLTKSQRDHVIEATAFIAGVIIKTMEIAEEEGGPRVDPELAAISPWVYRLLPKLTDSNEQDAVDAFMEAIISSGEESKKTRDLE